MTNFLRKEKLGSHFSTFDLNRYMQTFNILQLCNINKLKVYFFPDRIAYFGKPLSITYVVNREILQII